MATGSYLTPIYSRSKSEVQGDLHNWTAAEWNQVVFRDESRFNLSIDDNRARVCGDPMVVRTVKKRCRNTVFSFSHDSVTTLHLETYNVQQAIGKEIKWAETDRGGLRTGDQRRN
ncbi:hypothetical protein TNCV_4339561 [Trichonephila clavipes]|nr:hypothetical protein TNCV_4339561 [Trichonephila clavipes]